MYNVVMSLNKVLHMKIFVPGMRLSKKQPIKPPTRIVVLNRTVSTPSATSFPVFMAVGCLIIHFDSTFKELNVSLQSTVEST